MFYTSNRNVLSCCKCQCNYIFLQLDLLGQREIEISCSMENFITYSAKMFLSVDFWKMRHLFIAFSIFTCFSHLTKCNLSSIWLSITAASINTSLTKLHRWIQEFLKMKSRNDIPLFFIQCSPSSPGLLTIPTWFRHNWNIFVFFNSVALILLVSLYLTRFSILIKIYFYKSVRMNEKWKISKPFIFHNELKCELRRQ